MLSNHEDGFTLLEVTLAMVIMGIVLFILGLFFSSRAHYELSTEETIAVYLAQEKMEEIIGTKIHEVVDNPIHGGMPWFSRLLLPSGSDSS